MWGRRRVGVGSAIRSHEIDIWSMWGRRNSRGRGRQYVDVYVDILQIWDRLRVDMGQTPRRYGGVVWSIRDPHVVGGASTIRRCVDGIIRRYGIDMWPILDRLRMYSIVWLQHEGL